MNRQSNRVNVGTVVGNDAQGKNDKTELSKATQRPEKHCRKKSASLGRSVAFGILVLAIIERGGSHDSDTQHLSEKQRNDQADPNREENFGSGLIPGLVDCVICCVAGPPCGKTINNASKTENTPKLAGTYAHGNVDEISGMREDAENDDENDGSRNPGPELVHVDNLVTEEGYTQRTHGDDDDASITRNVIVDGIDHLCTDNRVHC